MMELSWKVWVFVSMSRLGRRRYSKGGLIANQKLLRKSHWIGLESNCEEGCFAGSCTYTVGAEI